MYQHGNVTVDDRFVRFGSKSFAINKITSVDVREDTVKGNSSYVTWWVIAGLLLIPVLFGLIGAAAKGADGSFTSVAPLLLFGALAAFAGWRSWLKRASITTYRLFLVTAASETQAFATQDGADMMNLRDAIEDAMSRST